MIDQTPMGEELDSFGLAYHGLYVFEPDGTSYIRLKNGRRIYPSGSGDIPAVARPSFGVSALVDNGMPSVSLALDDPDAELWSVAISALAGSSPPRVYPFHYRSHVMYRRDPASGELVKPIYRYPSASINLVADWGSKNVHIVTPYHGIQPYRVTISQSEHELPDEFFGSNFHAESVVMGVTKDGCRFLIRVDAKVGARIYGSFIAEITVGNKFTTASASVAVKYSELNMDGKKVYGEPLNYVAAIFRDGNQIAMDVPYSLSLGDTYPSPEYFIFAYYIGESSASASSDILIGAIYNSDDNIEPVFARWHVEQRIAASTPVPLPGHSFLYASPTYVINRKTLSIVAGSKETTGITITATEDRNNPTNIVEKVSCSTGDSMSRSEEYRIYDWAGLMRSSIAVANIFGGLPNEVFSVKGVGSIYLSVSDLEANLYSPSIRIVNPSANHEELVVVGCITPKRADNGIKRSGNLLDLHGEASELVSRYFMRGAYNPVTGEVERNRTDGATYVWV